MEKITAGLYNRISTYIGFFIVGSSMGLWAVSIPHIKIRLNIDDFQLGSILMFLSIGALIAMLITDKLVSKFGCRRVFVLSIFLLISALYGVNIMPNTATLTIMVALLGIGVGIADVTANIQAVYMESAFDKKLMSGFHSMYSGGSFATGLVSSFMLTNMLSFTAVLFIILIFMAALIFISFKGFVPYGSYENAAPSSKKFNMPSKLLLIAGFICFTAYMTEGAMLDWASILLIDNKNFPKEMSGYGFSIFFATVTIGRLAGDYIASKFHPGMIIACSIIVAIAGINMILYFENNLYLYIGFAVTGLGASNIIPMAISVIPRLKGSMSLNTAIAVVSTIGYSGSLLGPAVIGYISHLSSLLTAFIFICILLAAALVFSLKLRGK